MLLEPGRLIGAYEILELLGQGGMGEVYRARDTHLPRFVAIKVVSAKLESDESALERLKREAHLASSLNHPAIVTILDVGEIEGRPYIVMEWIDGQPLSSRLAAGRMKVRDAVELMAQVAAGLAAAHSAGVVHRDLKPQNIMVVDGHRAKIVDFGLSKVTMASLGPDEPTAKLPDDLTAPHTVLGSVGYMAPEQVSGRKATFHTDQFALGVVLYEMLTGHRAFKRDTAWQTIAAIAGEDPTPLAELCPGLPPQLVTIVERCLAKRPEDRYGSTRDLARDLAEVRDLATSSRKILPPPPPPVPRRRVVAVILVLTLAGAYYLWHQLGPGGSPPVKIQQVAVLPFTCADQKDQVFCDGLVETLTTGLSGLDPSLRVVSQEILRRDLPADKVNSKMARQALGAPITIKADVARRGSAIEVKLTRIDESGNHEQTITIAESQEASLQGSLVAVAAELLGVKPSRSSWARLRGWWKGRGFAASAVLEGGGTEVPRAYDAYVRGRGQLNALRPFVPTKLNVSMEKIAPIADWAISTLNEAVQADPSYALAHAALCEAYWLKSELDLARRQCQTALQIDDQLVVVYLTLARVAKDAGEKFKNEYITWATRAVSLAESQNLWVSDARHELGAAYENAEDKVNAKALYSAATKASPDDPQAYSDFCRFYAWAKDYATAAEETCRRALDLTPENTRVLNNFGAILAGLARYEEASAKYQISMDIRPTHAASAMLGLCDYQRELYDDAVIHYRDALTRGSTVKAWQGLGASYFASGAPRTKWLGPFEQVIELTERTMGKQQQTMDQLKNEELGPLVDAYAMVGRSDKARIGLTVLESRKIEDDEEMMFLVGVVHERIHERAVALNWLSRAVVAGYPCDQVTRSPFLKELRKDPKYQSVGCK